MLQIHFSVAETFPPLLSPQWPMAELVANQNDSISGPLVPADPSRKKSVEANQCRRNPFIGRFLLQFGSDVDDNQNELMTPARQVLDPVSSTSYGPSLP